MNKVEYNLLNKLYDKRILDQKYLEGLYRFYKTGSRVYNYQINISKTEFEKILNTIYDVLRFRINDDKFKIVSDHYVILLMADAKDGHNVDANWFIDHIYYMCVGIKKKIKVNKYKDCIPFIQQELIKEFNIEENLKEKVSRKIYTKFMIN